MKEFRCGANNKCFCHFEHMVLQFKEVADCLTVLFPQCDFWFMFHRACRHDKKREEKQNTKIMSKINGGKQPIMRDSD